MKFLVRGLMVIAALVALIIVVGLFLPRDHAASVEVTYATAPPEVWAAMERVEEYPAWRRGIDSVALLQDRDGRRAWREFTGRGGMSMGVEESDPGRRWVVRILDDDLPFGGTWTYELSPDGAGTRLVLTEEGSVYNPIFRFVSRFIMGHDATMRAWTDDLRAHLGEADA
ncbi:MAG: SRPBCC family protein [Gemmatimonadota bacterium]